MLVTYYIQDEPTPKIGGGVALTLKAERRGCVVTFQRTTGTLSPGGHPGSYNGQDAWNDMLITDDGNCDGNRTGKRRNNAGGGVQL